MLNIDSNQILLLAFLVVLLGVGTYFTYVRQGRTLNRLDEKIDGKDEAVQNVRKLQDKREKGEARLSDMRDTWASQFKVVPRTVSSAELVAYLAANTQTGFKTFNVESKGRASGNGYSTYTFRAEGKGYFTSLYRLIWKVENRRSFYRVQNFEIDYLEERTTDEEKERTTMDVLVSFKMDVQAIYGLLPDVGNRKRRQTPFLQASGRYSNGEDYLSASLPMGVLPEPVPEINPFYPLIFEQVPPNEAGRLNVETAQFISIVGGQAVFETRSGVKRLEEGDKVYLGRITEINPSEGLLRARLNRGGVIDYVERHLNPTSPLQLVDEPPQTR